MTPDQWSDRLSDYLDGELPAAERARLEAHLAACESCRGELADLRRIRDLAREAPGPPTSDPWPQIEAALGERARRRAPSLKWAAAILLPALIGASAWWAVSRESRTEGGTAPIQAQADPGAPEADELEAAFDAMIPRLDPRTVATVQDSLRTLDAALTRVETELASDQDNPLLRALAERVREQKRRMLQSVVTS